MDHGRLLAAGRPYRWRDFDRLLVVGAGKAAAGMGLAVESLLGDRISGGLLALPRGERPALRFVSQVAAGHPLPDAGSARAAAGVLELLAAVDERTLVLCLLSGGASAMLAAPAPGLTLADKRGTSELLLRAGAAIDGLNAVRKHLSRIKGGRLAAAAAPAALLTLAVSDVIGDRQEVIGSGPTAADPSTFADAWAAVARCRLQAQIPSRVRTLLERGLAGQEEETIKPGDPRLARAAYLVVGSNADAIAGAREKALALGWQVQVRPVQLRGEARQAARLLAGEARRALRAMAPGEKRCLLSGGETTVTVSGGGRGGRNQELALAFALEIAGDRGIELLSAGTDGLDGPTAAAGAVVDGATVATAAGLGLDAAAFLANNDSYSFFSELDRRSGGRRHLRTGPTGANVMDLQVILLARPAAAAI